MPRLRHLTEMERKKMLLFPCMDNDNSPWTPLTKDLSVCKLGLVTSAGLHLRSDKPFSADHLNGDQSYRVIPSNVTANDIIQSHYSIGFDHTGVYQDINIVFPIQRLKELEKRKIIGSLSNNFYSFMGALRNPNRIISDTGPEVAKRMKDEGVDAVILTPI